MQLQIYETQKKIKLFYIYLFLTFNMAEGGASTSLAPLVAPLFCIYFRSFKCLLFSNVKIVSIKFLILVY